MLMQRGLALAAVVAMLVAAGCSSESARQPHSARGGEYYDSESGFSMIPPAGWEQMSQSGTKVMYLSPEVDNFRENINVVVEKLPRAMSLDAYVTAAKRQLKTMPGYTHIGAPRKKINGRDAEMMVWEHNMENTQMRVLTCIIIRGKAAYLVTCTARPETYEQYRPTFEQVCDSVVID